MANMKLSPVDYFGFAAMDRRFSAPMLPWIISEIKRRNKREKINIILNSGYISAYVVNKEEPLFRHILNSTLKPQVVPQSAQDSKGGSFLYTLKGDDGLYYCHLFKAKDSETVQELFNAMKEESSTKYDRDRKVPQRSFSSAATLTSIGADISPSSSHFFEVLYLGKIKLNHARVPYGKPPPSIVSQTFIDDALVKLRGRGLEKSKSSASNLLVQCQQLKHQINTPDFPSNVKRDSVDSNASELGSNDDVSASNLLSPKSSASLLGASKVWSGSVETLPLKNDRILKSDEQYSDQVPKKSISPSIQLPETMRNRAASTGSVLTSRRNSCADGSDEHNRTMLFQVGRQDLRLISPDRKQVLLHKQLNNVATCVQGIVHPEHFGFICRDPGAESFVAYVFKCQSESVADDLVGAISQAFIAGYDSNQKEKHAVFSCEHCPMVWYKKLAQDIEGQNERKTQSIIFSRMEMLPEEEHKIIVTKFKGSEAGGSGAGSSVREQNNFLMALLRAHCESKQSRHIHDTAENRSEFLNQYLSVGVGSTIFMKAKRSLTNSFDNLMKRKGSKDDFSLPNQIRESNQFNSMYKAGSQSPLNLGSQIITEVSPESSRPRSLRVSPEQQLTVNTSPKSPMMDIFLKVGNSPKMSPTESDQAGRLQTSGSWRQAILNRVVTPGKDKDNKENDKLGISLTKNQQTNAKKRSKEELRELWRNAINQQLILIRMEKENARLKVHQKEATVKRIKLDYDELSSCARELVEVWDLLVSKESRISTKCDNQMLLQAIKQGVPRGKRGEVWHFLAEQFCLKQPPMETRDFPNYNMPYELLLKQLTSQQHAILIDLGRTFPNHPYFSSPLGPGQLALFNLLKGYSLLDHEVGYCQGLSFVAGVLLLHMTEDQAFLLLRHLMFRRGLRKLYLPDMAALQLHLYQLSRLLHDRLPAIYSHFDKHEVSPTLYAAPWLLTLFASQFPLGFVTRVFDLLFLESSEVIFRVALALLEDHQDQLLDCDSFEEIMEYLKVKLPAVDKATLDRVMKRVFYPDMEIGKQLNEYRVEYQVLQEEMLSVKPQIENMEKLEMLNKQLTQQNLNLTSQLEIALNNLQRVENTRLIQQSSIHKLESQNRSLEVTVATLGAFIQQIIDTRTNIDIPGDVRRIVAQLGVAQTRRNNSARSLPLKMIEGNNNKFDMVKSNSTGKESQKFLKGGMNNPYPLKSALSQPNLGSRLEKMSSFFANSHNHIEQRRAEMAALKNEGSNDENDSKTVNIDIKITDTAVPSSNIVTPTNNNLEIESMTSEKSMPPPLSNPKIKLKSSKSAHELGSVKKVLTTRLEDTTEESVLSSTGTMHPLDTCSDVNFKYGGTTKLKSIKSVRLPSQGIPNDNLNKDIQNKNPEILSR